MLVAFVQKINWSFIVLPKNYLNFKINFIDFLQIIYRRKKILVMHFFLSY